MNNNEITIHKPPSEEEIQSALKQLFNCAKQLDKKLVMECIYPRDILLEQDLQNGEKQISFTPFWEIDELNSFVKLQLEHFNSIVDDISKARICLVLYSHIMEADFPLAVLYNLLRILCKENPSWVFLGFDKRQNETVCEHPSGKIREILRRSTDSKQAIGELLNRMWKDTIRNSFMHSNYTFKADRFIPCKDLSPISRKITTSIQENAMNPTPTIEDIICYGLSAVSFLSSFNHEYKIMRDLYQIDFTRK